MVVSGDYGGIEREDVIEDVGSVLERGIIGGLNTRSGVGAVVSGGGEMGFMLREMREKSLEKNSVDIGIEEDGVIKVGGYDGEGKWKGVEVNVYDGRYEDVDVVCASLSNEMMRISLSGLGLVRLDVGMMRGLRCPLFHIREISLAANKLGELDLGFCKVCVNLESLILNGNSLTGLDLKPLVHNVRLERLWLHNNMLKSIDLRPLASTIALRSLYLDGNQLHDVTLDLTPLRRCKVLRALRLGRNKLGGKLDITPLMGCVALSTLDVGGSVELEAMIDMDSLDERKAAAALPPALRRKAAMVQWKRRGMGRRGKRRKNPVEGQDVEQQNHLESSESSESSSSEEDDEEELEGGDGRSRSSTVSSGHKGGAEQEIIPGNKTGGVQSDKGPEKGSFAQLKAKNAESIPAEATNEYLKFRQKHRHRHHEYTAVLVDFRRNALFRAEALLAEHGNLKTIALTLLKSQPICSLSAALSKADVILVQPSAEKVTADIRATKPSVPIIVVGSPDSSEAAGRCLRNGAGCFLTSPLNQRDALTIRALAQQSAREKSVRMKRARSLTRSTSIGEDGLTNTLEKEGYTPAIEYQRIEDWTSPVTSPSSSGDSNSPTCSPPWSPVEYERNCVGSKTFVSGPGSRSSSRRSIKLNPTHVFERLRAKCAGLRSSHTSVEESALTMLFSRMGRQAAVAKDFHSVATLCGLPVCSVSLLFRAALRCSKWWDGEKDATNKGGEGEVTYEMFQRFWRGFLNGRKPETRLFHVLVLAGVDEDQWETIMELEEGQSAKGRSAHLNEYQKMNGNRNAYMGRVGKGRQTAKNQARGPVCLTRYKVARQAIVQLAEGLVKGKNQIIAGVVLSYALNGAQWRLLPNRKLITAKLCASLIAAESGVFQDVCSRLRADRLAEIRQAFSVACNMRGARYLSRSDAVYFFADRELYTPGALEIMFDRVTEGKQCGLTLRQWAPLYLSANGPGLLSGTEYLWDFMDLNHDGYIDEHDLTIIYEGKEKVAHRLDEEPRKAHDVWRMLFDATGRFGRNSWQSSSCVWKTAKTMGEGREATGDCWNGDFGASKRMSKTNFCTMRTDEREYLLREILFISEAKIKRAPPDTRRIRDTRYLDSINAAERAVMM